MSEITEDRLIETGLDGHGLTVAEIEQIQQMKIKAEKFDQITLQGTRPVTADWIRKQIKLIINFEEENKQLKEQVRTERNYKVEFMDAYANRGATITNLNQKLKRVEDKIDSHIYACNEILKDGKDETDEQKAITEKYTQILKYFTELKRILES